MQLDLKSKKLREYGMGIMFILPLIIMIILFIAYPVVQYWNTELYQDVYNRSGLRKISHQLDHIYINCNCWHSRHWVSFGTGN